MDIKKLELSKEVTKALKPFFKMETIGTGSNALKIVIGDLIIYTSYDTIIGFKSKRTGLILIKNYWSNATGKHLNFINPDKSIRLEKEAFIEELKKLSFQHRLFE